MSTLTRKQREIAAREGLILDTAFELLIERGYLGLTMERIAAGVEYSKGTIYQHFPNKEEVVAALSIRSAEQRIEMFQRAATFRGSPRERMTGIGVADDLFVRLYPHHFQLEKILAMHSLREKTTESRQQAMDSCNTRCFEVLGGIIRDGVAQGDLTLASPEAGAELAFGLWSMALGGHLIGSDPNVDIERKMGIENPQAILNKSYQLLLDGYDWSPRSTELDYAEVIERIQNEVFPDEYRRVQGR